MSFEISASENFAKGLKRLSKKYPSIKEDMLQLAGSLSKNPFQGTPLGKDCFKIRLSIKSKGKGKSGGARVISCIFSMKKTVVLLSIYDKSEKDNIESKELEELIKNI